MQVNTPVKPGAASTSTPGLVTPFGELLAEAVFIGGVAMALVLLLLPGT